MAKILIVAATFYEDIAEELINGATEILEKAGHTWDQLIVPGAFEIPAAIKFADASAQLYDAYVALGCVIRGETTHYEHICMEVNRALQNLSLEGIALSNGVLTVENRDQAMARAKRSDKNKGAEFAQATLRMLEIKQQYALKSAAA